MADSYDEKEVMQKSDTKCIHLIPEDVAVGLMIKNSFINDLQHETIYRYNDKIK